MDIKSLLILKCFLLLILYFNPIVEGDIPYGLCADPQCSEPVSRGITMLRYTSPDDSRISFEPNEEVIIYVKEYGPKKDLWGVTVRGNRGYISKNFIRETQALAKQLVVAQIEFKTSVLVTNDYTVTSHVHVSSVHHQSGSHLSNTESIYHSQTIQHDMNSIPNSQQHLRNNPAENLQSSQLPLSSQIDSSQFGLHSNFDPSAQLYNVPDHSSQVHYDSRNGFVSSQTADIRSENIIPSQSQVPDVRHPSFHQNDPSLNSLNLQSGANNVPNFNIENNLDFSPRDVFEPNSVYPSETSQTFNQHPSSLPLQQQLQHQQFLYQQQLQQQQQQLQHQHQFPSYVSEIHSSQHPSSAQVQQQIQSSIPGMQKNQYLSNDQQPPQQFQSFQVSETLITQYPSSVQIQAQQQEQFHSIPVSELQINQNPSSVQFQQQQQLQSPYPSEMHSSSVSEDNFSPLGDEDLSRTYAMLSNMGYDDESYLYANSHSGSQAYHSSQNVETNFGGSQVEGNAVPSQSQYSSVQFNEASLHSSLNTNPNMHDENNINSVPSNDALLQSSLNSYPNMNEASNIINSDVTKESIEKSQNPSDLKSEGIVTDETIVEEEDESELLAESEEESEDEEDEEIKEIAEADDVVFSSKDSENNKNEFHLKSSMSSTVANDKSSEVHQVISNSMENSAADSLHKENSFLVEEEKILDEPISVSSDGLKDIGSDKNSTDPDNVQEKIKAVNEPYANNDVPFEQNNDDALESENIEQHTTPPISDFFLNNEQDSESNKIVNTVDIDGLSDSIRSTYQIRNLKGEYMTNEEQSNSESGSDENNTDTDSDDYSSFQNGLNALKSFVDSIMSWIPEPLYSTLMDLQNKGISPRVPVFTTLCGIVGILLIVPLVYIKESSKESKLISELTSVEKKAYTLSAANIALEDKLESIQSELDTLQDSMKEEKTKSESIKFEFERQADELEQTKSELENCLEEIDLLKEKENEFVTLLNNHEKEKENLLEHKISLDKIITDQENTIESLTNQLQESENHLKVFEEEKIKFLQMKEDYEEKIALFDQNCNQLLQEAEVWNLRVNELTSKVNEETLLKTELETSLKEKNEEIESLKQLVETFKSFEELEETEDEPKTKEEKLQSLINSSMILNQLKKEEDKNRVIEEQLGIEKSKILDMEVELLDAKSEIDKLKLSYNQALQDKAEAQTKLDVLTNYFKDKEIQLQKQLGAQEAVRQKKEEDANSAERRICLIEQENSSYKYQVASMKQEMEETERNLKSQIAAQEKKAHENWIAARAAERKLEDMKQEVTQLRQRLTLLEREQENWNNSSRDEIIRPVPKRIPGVNEELGSQDMNTSERGMFPLPPPLHDRLPPVPPMMLPPDRPLPPLPPPPIPPMFLPPMERFRPQPWHLPPDHSSDYRTTPPEFVGGRESTPPRGRQSTMNDGDMGPNTSSPLTTDTRDSRNSTPPHLLPDFHDVPPQPGRPFFPPPHLGHPRLPLHPPFRRDPRDQLPKRLDGANEYSSRGSQPSTQEQWQHSRV